MTWPWRERKAAALEGRSVGLASRRARVEIDLADANKRAYELAAESRALISQQTELRAKAERLRSAPWWKPVRGVR